MNPKTVFARDATGLVREVSARDALIYNLMWMAPLGIFVYGVWACVLFPGVDLPSTVLVSGIVAIVVAVFYALFNASMPRSGGDYVWNSRILHPSIGFAANFAFAVLVFSFPGVLMFWVTQYSLAPMFSLWGMASVSTWLASVNGTLEVAIVLFLLFGILISRGVKATHVFLRITFILTIAAILTYIAVLLSVGAAGFKANFNALSGMNYDQVVAAGTQAGYPTSYILSSTLLGVAFTYFSFTGFNASVYYSGEIKKVQKSQFYAIVGAVVIYVIILWSIYFVTVTVMGSQFVGSISYLYGTGSSAYTLPFAPFFQYLFRFASVGNPVEYSIVAIGFALMSAAAILTELFIATRMIFAWAFDRVVPMSLAKVDAKYSSPYMSIIVATIIGMLSGVLFAYTNLLNFFLYATFGWMIMQTFTSISGIVFPWRRKNIYEASPGIVKKKVAGIPLISLLGVGALICSIYIGWASVAPAYEGTFQPGYLVFTISLFIIGFIIYGISSAYRRRTGVPLEMTFKEVPPE
jgi:amino acid transporter